MKFYTLCENSHWCALQIKLCHRFKKDNFEVKESNHDSNAKGDDKKSNPDILSQNSFNENEVIGSDVEDADNYDDTFEDITDDLEGLSIYSQEEDFGLGIPAGVMAAMVSGRLDQSSLKDLSVDEIKGLIDIGEQMQMNVKILRTALSKIEKKD